MVSLQTGKCCIFQKTQQNTWFFLYSACFSLFKKCFRCSFVGTSQPFQAPSIANNDYTQKGIFSSFPGNGNCWMFSCVLFRFPWQWRVISDPGYSLIVGNLGNFSNITTPATYLSILPYSGLFFNCCLEGNKLTAHGVGGSPIGQRANERGRGRPKQKGCISIPPFSQTFQVQNRAGWGKNLLLMKDLTHLFRLFFQVCLWQFFGLPERVQRLCLASAAQCY